MAIETAATVARAVRAPEWMYEFMEFRQRLFLATVEPIIVFLLGPCLPEEAQVQVEQERQQQQLLQSSYISLCQGGASSVDCIGGGFGDTSYNNATATHRRLLTLFDMFNHSSYLTQGGFKETSMSFATLVMLFVTLSCVFLIFLSCFYHNQKTSPLFISPRRHRLPKLVPPPLPVDEYFSWVKVCFFLSDEEIINRVGYDSLVFLRFHRLALRCIVKMSIFSFAVLLPLNFTGGGQASAQDLKEYMGSLFFTDFMMFTMANVVQGSPRLWVHCFAAYLLTGIVVRELLIEYETFNSIRHRYLLSREPHLRTVLVTNIPRHLRSGRKITSYFKHVYPNAVHSVFMCQNLLQLESMIHQRTGVLSKIEKELLVLCRTEKRKLYELPSAQFWRQLATKLHNKLEDHQEPCLNICCSSSSSLCCSCCCCCPCFVGPQERLANLYSHLEELNNSIEQEQNRRRRVMKMLDRMEAGEGAADIDYVLASPFFDMESKNNKQVGNGGDNNNNNRKTTINAKQRRVLGLHPPAASTKQQQTAGGGATTATYNDNNNKSTTTSTGNSGRSGGGGGPYQPPSAVVPGSAATTSTTTTATSAIVDSSSSSSSVEQQQQQPWPESIPEGENEEEDDSRGDGGGYNNNVGMIGVTTTTNTTSGSQLRARSPMTSYALETTGDTTFTAGATKALLPENDPEMGGRGDTAGVFVKENGSGRGGGGGVGPLKRGNSSSSSMDGAPRSVAKAKQAIRHYGRFNQYQDRSFLGRPIRSSSSSSFQNNNNSTTTNIGDGIMKTAASNPALQSGAGIGGEAASYQLRSHIEDHINEVTDKAFVVMRTFTAATIAIQSMHSSKPGSMQVATAPEPRDILWKNIYISKGAHRTRSYLGEALVLLIVTFFVVPVALVSLLVSESALINASPRLAQLDQASAFFSAAIALVQPICIVGLQQLLPPLFMLIGEAEGILSFSEVQMRAFSRYFLFQVVNVFLVTCIVGSIFETIADIIERPESAFVLLGNSLPKLSSFFITFITVKTFLALGFELVRTMSLVQATLRYILLPNPTLRMQRTVTFGMRAIDDPGWFPFHKILAQDMLVVVISVVFAVVAPLVLLPCALFCLFSRIMWTHHHLYVYESVFESGGQFWPKIFRRFVFGLIIAQMTITGQLFAKNARHEAYATIALMFLTYFFLRSTRARYDPTSATLPLEVATVMDISLHQEELEAQRQQQQQQAARGGGGGVEKRPLPPPLDPGAMIGRFDPFQKAYLQSALRANPRARPEQPFPAAQLGRETSGPSHSVNPSGNTVGGGGDAGGGNFDFRSDDSTEDDWQDSGATVRLKSMNQQDRRLINRWWKDQFQRAGKQNFLPVLIGEECGTLIISGSHNAADVELHDQSSFPINNGTHTMV